MNEFDFVRKGDLLFELDATNALSSFARQSKIDSNQKVLKNTLDIIDGKFSSLRLSRDVSI